LAQSEIVQSIPDTLLVAQTLYRETDASREARRKVAEERKMMSAFEAAGHPGRAHQGKPSKRDRRLIHQFRERE